MVSIHNSYITGMICSDFPRAGLKKLSAQNIDMVVNSLIF